LYLSFLCYLVFVVFMLSCICRFYVILYLSFLCFLVFVVFMLSCICLFYVISYLSFLCYLVFVVFMLSCICRFYVISYLSFLCYLVFVVFMLSCICRFYVILYLSQYKLSRFLPQTPKRSPLLIQRASSTLEWDFCQIHEKLAVILKVFILSLAPVWHEDLMAIKRRNRRRHDKRQWNVGFSRNYSFTFCWPCISIYSFKEKPTLCTIYLQYISLNTSTCFGRIYSPSSGGTTVWIQ